MNTPAKSIQKTMPTATGSSLADVLERVLDKGIVIAGDISVSVATTELLTIRIRLLIASVDKAREMGINWWENHPYFSAPSKELVETNQKLLDRIEALESELAVVREAMPKKLPPSNSLESLLEDL